MLVKYALRAVEYLFYATASLASLPLLASKSNKLNDPTDNVAIVFILIGVGVLLPRAIAYSRWSKVMANVGLNRVSWDGERSAPYSYEIDNQRYTGTLRAVHGSARPSRLTICVNPAAPWIRYPVYVNIWLFGASMLGMGIFILLSGQNYFS